MSSARLTVVLEVELDVVDVLVEDADVVVVVVVTLLVNLVLS